MPYQIAGIPVIRTSFVGTEWIAGQDFAAGPGSTWRAQLRDLLTNVQYPEQSYTVDTTISSALSGYLISNTGAVDNRSFTLPAGGNGLWYLFHNDSDTLTLTLQPNGSDRISYGLANKSLRMLTRGWIVLQWDGGRWEITEAAGIYEIEL